MPSPPTLSDVRNDDLQKQKKMESASRVNLHFKQILKTIPKQLPFSSSKPYFCSTFFDMPTQYYLFLSLALFCIGVMGVLMRRNAIIILMCIELMLNAVNLLMVTFSKMHNNADAQIFVFFIMVVAAAEVSIGLSIIVLMYRKVHSIDVNILNRLKN